MRSNLLYFYLFLNILRRVLSWMANVWIHWLYDSNILHNSTQSSRHFCYVCGHTCITEEGVNKDFIKPQNLGMKAECKSAWTHSVFISLYGLTSDGRIMLFVADPLILIVVFLAFVLICHQSHLMHLDENPAAHSRARCCRHPLLKKSCSHMNVSLAEEHLYAEE